MARLKALVYDPATPDKVRLVAMDSLAIKGWLPKETDSLMQFGQRMVDLARKLGDRQIEGYALVILGTHYLNISALDKADSLYSLAEDRLGTNGDPNRKAGLYNNQGQLLQERGLIQQAKDKYDEAIVLYQGSNNLNNLSRVEANLSVLLANEGDLSAAVAGFTRALQFFEQLHDSVEIGNNLANLGTCNDLLGDLMRSRYYYKKAIDVFERIGYWKNLPRPLVNITGGYLQDSLDMAKFYAARLRVAVDRTGEASIMMQYHTLMAQLYSAEQLPDSAMHHMRLAEELAREGGSLAALTEVQQLIASRLYEEGKRNEAVAMAENMLRTNRKDVQSQMIATRLLHPWYKELGQYEKALVTYELFVALADSLKRKENQRELIKQEYKYDYDKQALSDSLNFAAETAIQQKQVQKQKLMRNGFMGGFALVALFAGVFFFQRNRISKEKARSEELLLNILPEEVAEELKAKGSAEAVHIDQVTVLFTDFKGFTAMSETLTPQELVRDLNECFSAFDRITEKYGIEKIKTIGDAYMAAGGLPVPNATHATDVVKAALEIRDFIAEGKVPKIAAGLPFFEVRIGVHTGPVVAGIVGVKKFSYDIWGDTVNTASRMESSGEVGQVNISGTTFELVKDYFECAHRGKIQAKGKGEIDMYFVEGRI